MVMLALVPPRSLTADDWVNAENIVSWGVTIIFVSINGLPVLQDLARPVERKVGQPSDGADGIGVLGLYHPARVVRLCGGWNFKTRSAFLELSQGYAV